MLAIAQQGIDLRVAFEAFGIFAHVLADSFCPCRVARIVELQLLPVERLPAFDEAVGAHRGVGAHLGLKLHRADRCGGAAIGGFADQWWCKVS